MNINSIFFDWNCANEEESWRKLELSVIAGCRFNCLSLSPSGLLWIKRELFGAYKSKKALNWFSEIIELFVTQLNLEANLQYQMQNSWISNFKFCRLIEREKPRKCKNAIFPRARVIKKPHPRHVKFRFNLVLIMKFSLFACTSLGEMKVSSYMNMCFKLASTTKLLMLDKRFKLRSQSFHFKG